MDITHHGRKIVWLFIAIGALAIFTISIVAYVSSRERAAIPSNGDKMSVEGLGNKAVPETVVTEVSENTEPEFFPEDMPSESGATVVKNYNTTTPDGRKLGTRVYVTAKTVGENYNIFKAYFEKSGWTVTAAPAVRGSSSQTLLATKGSMQAQVTIGDDPVAKARTVAIIITQFPK